MNARALLLSLASATAVFAQSVTRDFGSAVFPGGRSAPSSGITRNFGSVVFPGGGATGAAVRTQPAPGRNSNFHRSPTVVYAFPVYVGAYDNSNSYAAPEPPPPPPEQEPPPPRYRTSTVYQPEPEPVEPPAKVDDSPHYLLAFKDHSIYSAVAYWADGDTLHYFTTGNVHNQASLTLIDRELTERLNRELGIDFSLPPAR